MTPLPAHIAIEPLVAQLIVTDFFQGLGVTDLSDILRYGIEGTLAADEYCFHQGSPAYYVYILLEGQIKVSQLSPEGQQMVMRLLNPFEIFGCVAALSAGAYPGSAQATKPCHTLALSHSDILHLMQQYPQLAINAFQMMVKRTHELQERYLELATEPVAQRLAHELLRLLEKNGVSTEQGILLDMPLSRQDLAEMVGSTLFTISRLLSTWENKGIVLSGREQLTVLDVGQLEQFSFSLCAGTKISQK